ncbi:MAG: hypothetical protein AAGA20_20995 [Planctomycetota bacterium]
MKLLPVAALLVSPAAAQSFNIDVGMNLDFFAGAPNSGYGAASGQSGTWNAFMPTFVATTLDGLDASATGVTLRSDATSTFNVFPGVMTPNDDQKLMEDFHLTPNLNTPSTWTFEGLMDGTYTVYTYASDPSIPTIRTEISVMGSVDPPQEVGAGWPGAHALGLTYARHDVTVSGGTLEVQALVVGGQLDSGVLNGFQLVFGGGNSSGINYCNAAPNSTGQTARMSATGSPVVAQNDVTIACDRMPVNAFAFFLTSQVQGFVMNPGGSAGNLCLGGQIGRFVGPGQILSTGLAGMVSLDLDLSQLPSPTGPIAVQPGDTWNFTAWFRDTGPSGATSNFGDGLSIDFL